MLPSIGFEGFEGFYRLLSDKDEKQAMSYGLLLVLYWCFGLLCVCAIHLKSTYPLLEEICTNR